MKTADSYWCPARGDATAVEAPGTVSPSAGRCKNKEQTPVPLKGFGEVYLARKKDGSDAGKLYAMKNMKRRLLKRNDIDHAWTERRVFEETRDTPFFVQLHYAFQSNDHLHLVMDYVAGKDVNELLEQRGRFTEKETRFFSAEVILALQHLHELGIVHRDVKPENILLDAADHVVLTYFGVSKEFPSDQENKRTYSCCGTPEYMAPEVIRRIGDTTWQLIGGAWEF